MRLNTWLLTHRRALGLNALGFLGVFAVYLATTTWHGWQSVDTMATLVPSWQLAMHGNLTLDHIHLSRPIPWFMESGGRLVSNRFPGPIFAAVPFYWMFGNPSHPTLPPAALTSALIAALAVVVMFHLLRRLSDTRTALVATAVFAFATATWSVSSEMLWTHGPAQLCVLLAVLAVAKERWLLAGVAGGAALLNRPHLALIPAVLGLYFAWRHRSLRPALLVALGTVPGVVALIGYDIVTFHNWSPLAYHQAWDYIGVSRIGGEGGGGGSAMRWEFVKNVLGIIVSPQRGLLTTTPFVIVLLFGLRPAWRAAPPWVRASALAGIAYILAQLNANGFTGGDSFYGSRLTIEWLTLSTPLLLLSWREWASATRMRTAALVLAVGCSFWIHASGAMFYVPRPDRGPWLTFDVFTALSQAPYAVVVVYTALLMSTTFVVARAVFVTLPAKSARGGNVRTQPEFVASAPRPTGQVRSTDAAGEGAFNGVVTTGEVLTERRLRANHPPDSDR